MKASVVLIIVIAAIILGTVQHRESVRLTHREKELIAVQAGQTDAFHENAESPEGMAGLPAKTERQEKPKLDLPGYLERYKKLFLQGSSLDDDTMKAFGREMADVSLADLTGLPELLSKAGISPPQAAHLYELASTKLLDRDPRLASEFALKGRDILNFHFVIRAWTARDPVAAGEWLERKSQEDPPLDAKTLHPHASHLEPIYMPGLQLAARIVSAPAEADLSALMELDDAKLNSTMTDLALAIPSAGLPVLLKRLGESGRPELIEMALSHYPDPADAREQLRGAGLPPDQFLKAATMLVEGLDPSDMRRGVAWYLRNTKPDSRSDGLKEIVTAWTRENPRSAREWLDKIPAGNDRRIAMAAYAEEFKHPKKKPVVDPL